MSRKENIPGQKWENLPSFLSGVGMGLLEMAENQWITGVLSPL